MIRLKLRLKAVSLSEQYKMLCELPNRTLMEFIYTGLRGNKRNLQLINILLLQPIMAFTATALGNVLLNSDDDTWQQATTYRALAFGYPFAFVIFMGACVSLCNTRRETDENPYDDICNRISWNVELTLSKIHCEPYGTVASSFAITAWSTVITPAAALIGNAMLQRIDDPEVAENIIATNAIGGAIVGAIPGTIAILYKLVKNSKISCCPEPGHYIYNSPCRMPKWSQEQPIQDEEWRDARFPSLGSTPFASNTPISPPFMFRRDTSGNTSSSTRITTPFIDLTATYNANAAKMKERHNEQVQKQWQRLGNNS